MWKAINFDKMFSKVKKDMNINPTEKINYESVKVKTKTDWIEKEIPSTEIKCAINGILIYDDKPVIVYIRDQIIFENAKHRSEPKFHIAQCSTLNQMLNQNRYAKYVVSTRTDGLFKINYIKNNKVIRTNEKEKLYVCKHCLQKINWNGYKKASDEEKNFIYEKF